MPSKKKYLRAYEFGGFKVFDPETRTNFHSGNLIFNENFTHRDDALRHHDKRRAEILAGADPDAQPVQNNDFKDPNAAAVRNLYTDPDRPAPDVDVSDSIEEEEQQVCAPPASDSIQRRDDHPSDSIIRGDEHLSCHSPDQDPLHGGAAGQLGEWTKQMIGVHLMVLLQLVKFVV